MTNLESCRGKGVITNYGNKSKKEIIEEVNSLIWELKHNWSKFGDLSDWVRKDIIKRLRKIKQITKMPKRIVFNERKELEGKKAK